MKRPLRRTTGVIDAVGSSIREAAFLDGPSKRMLDSQAFGN